MHYRAARPRLVRLNNTQNGAPLPHCNFAAPPRLIICNKNKRKIPVWEKTVCARTIGSALISPSFGYLSLHVHNQTVRP
jgi:hypothetical protein